MTKRKSTIIFIAVLLVSLLSGCGLFEKDVIVTPKPFLASIQKQDITADSNLGNIVPENTPVVSDYPSEKDYTVEIEGYPETVTMQLFDMSFWETGGPETGMYFDSSSYETSYYEGRYMIVPINCGEVSTFLQVSYYQDTTAIGLAPTVFFSYESDLDIEDLGDYPIENGYAHVVIGNSYDGARWIAYIIDAEGGSIVAVMRLAPEALEGHGPRLIAIAETIFVK